jgi:cytoskeletal protein CcmA (bactofilin family)
VSRLSRNYVANWGTRETPGVENWGGWRDLGICQEEVLIDLTTPQEKQSIQSISQFLLFATENLLLNSGVTIVGNIGANGSVSVGNVAAGWKTMITGDIYSKGAVSTTAEAVINGDVFASSLQLGWEAKHNGNLITDHDFNFSIARKTIPTSSQNARGKWQETIRPLPGNYREISVMDGGALELRGGVYNIRNLALNSNSIPIHLDIAPGENIQLNVQDSIRLGSGTKITFRGKTSPLSLRIYTNQTHDLIIPDHSEINAIITAPNARVVVNSGAKVNGAIFAREIEVLQGAVINSVPFITDVFHSEYHFAPAFDILTNEYLSVLPSGTPIEFVNVNAPDNFRVTQTNNGFRYLFEIEDTVTNLVSYYAINFLNSQNPAVFVNSNVSASGNGRSWGTAVKTLQEAIEIAQRTGERIHVAQGTYDGVEIGQGIRIIGGFFGGGIRRRAAWKSV